MFLINGVPCVQIELKTLGINPGRALDQIGEHKGHGYVWHTTGQLCR
jgi:type I restriction enzyme R subunit